MDGVLLVQRFRKSCPAYVRSLLMFMRAFQKGKYEAPMLIKMEVLSENLPRTRNSAFAHRTFTASYNRSGTLLPNIPISSTAFRKLHNMLDV